MCRAVTDGAVWRVKFCQVLTIFPAGAPKGDREFPCIIRRLQQKVPSSSGWCWRALLLADIDHFKRVNHTHGHLVGDQVIGATAQVLKSAVKGRNVVARFGGEEYMVLLPGTPGQGALALAEQIHSAFGKLRIGRSGSDEVIAQATISTGVATPLAGASVVQVIDRADKALYQPKNEGRNCVRLAGNAAAA